MSFASRLLAWYDSQKRDLPWRSSRDPWAIWVSEVMLQQTRVGVVTQLYPRFMKRYPTPAALSVATDDELLAAWKGLGYYRRARLLREAARTLVDHHDGIVPRDIEELRELPGVGLYTSGAIASIAFGAPELAVDGNVERVAARYLGIETNIKAAPATHRVREAVAGWMDRDRAGDFNQALMELGAVVCTPRQPTCSACPVAEECAARRDGTQDRLPVVPERKKLVEVQSRAVLVPLPEGRVLGSRIPHGEVNGGQIDLPGPGALVPMGTSVELESALQRLYGVAFQVGEVVTLVNHGITHHKIRLRVHRATCARGPGPNLMAARPDDETLPWTTVARKAFRQAALFLTANH